MVSFGGEPAVVGDEIIDFIKSRATASGLVEVNGSDRVMILVESIRYQGSLVREREYLRRVDAQGSALLLKPEANGA